MQNRRWLRRASKLASASVIAATLVITQGSAATAASGTMTFSSSDTWTIPAGVDRLTITASGARGGQGGLSGGAPGQGQVSTFSVDVEESQTLEITVGLHGAPGTSSVGGAGGAGWSTGGNGGDATGAAGGGGGGGGSTAVLLDSELLAVAAGGAGGGGQAGSSNGGAGGNAGSNGSVGSSGSVPGIVAGSSDKNGTAGVSATGANTAGGGGGGAGKDGGSGGGTVANFLGSAAAGGGGGSSYLGALATPVTAWAPTAPSIGDGEVIVKYFGAEATSLTMATPTGIVTGQEAGYAIEVLAGTIPAEGTVSLSTTNAASVVTPLGTAALVNGETTINAALPAGTHALTASFVPAPGSPFEGSTATGSVTIDKGATSIDVASTTHVSQRGDDVTIGAAVHVTDPAEGAPTGAVQFTVDGNPLGSPVVIDAAGRASLTTSQLAIGDNQISASYSGDTEFFGSTSADLEVHVNPRNVTVEIHSFKPETKLGEQAEFTAKVTSGAGLDPVSTGTVTFRAGNVDLSGPIALGPDGVAEFNYTDLAPGTHQINVVYDGGPDFGVARSADQTHVVNPGGVKLILAASPAQSPVGTATTISVNAERMAPAVGIPAGKVQLLINGTEWGTAVDLDAAGNANWGTAELPVGVHAFTVRYFGHDYFLPTETSITHQVIAQDATVTLATGPTSITHGEKVELTAEVIKSTGIATGKVEFVSGDAVLGTSNLDALAIAKLRVADLTPGVYNIGARYLGDDSTNPSVSQLVTVTVVPSNVTAVLNVSDSEVHVGDPLALSVQVTTTTANPLVGQVEIRNSGDLVATRDLDNSGQVHLVLADLEPGTHLFSARYVGDPVNGSTVTNTVPVKVKKNAVDVALTAAPAAVSFGETVTFEAEVTTTATAGVTGKVHFSSATQDFGEVELDANGIAVLAINDLAIGTHQVRAKYLGDAVNGSKISAGQTVTINANAVAVTLTATPNDVQEGEKVTLKAQVSTSSAGALTGDVQFYANGTPMGAPKSVDGNGTVTMSVKDFAAGTHELFAKYLGDATRGQARSTTETLEVRANKPVVTLTSNTAAAQVGQTVRWNAKVSVPSAASKPTGNVEFYVDGALFRTTRVDGNGQATVSTAGLKPGRHQMYAVYTGDALNRSATSNTVEVRVIANLVKIELAPDRIPVYRDQEVNVYARVSPKPGSIGMPWGAVQYYSGGKKLGKPVPVSGTKWGGTVLKGLKPGRHRVVGVFTPDPRSGYEGAVSDVSLMKKKKTKANSSVSMKLKRTNTHKVRVRAKVSLANGKKASGKVRIFVNGKFATQAKLKNGRVTVRLKGVPNEQVVMTVAYLGKGSAKPSSEAKTIARL